MPNITVIHSAGTQLHVRSCSWLSEQLDSGMGYRSFIHHSHRYILGSSFINIHVFEQVLLFFIDFVYMVTTCNCSIRKRESTYDN